MNQPVNSRCAWRRLSDKSTVPPSYSPHRAAIFVPHRRKPSGVARDRNVLSTLRRASGNIVERYQRSCSTFPGQSSTQMDGLLEN